MGALKDPWGEGGRGRESIGGIPTTGFKLLSSSFMVPPNRKETMQQCKHSQTYRSTGKHSHDAENLGVCESILRSLSAV
jgi:hypothetical protein